MDPNDQRSNALSSISGPRVKVMLVDDDEDSLEALRARLKSLGYEVACCESAREAFEQLKSELLPDLILLDLLMPDMNGWQFRIEQKKDPAWATIPVIVMSGDHSPQAVAIDAVAFLHKPFEDGVLIACIERATLALQHSRAVTRARELERLVSLGALVDGIAHEINNPLTFIFGGIDVLQRQLTGLVSPALAIEPHSVASGLRALERVKVGAERIAAVVRSVSLFALADLETVDAIDVHALLESCLQVASNEIRHGAQLVRAYEPVPLLVQGNPAKLGQVFLNLLLNALYAIRQSRGSDQVIVVATHREEDWVSVTITDPATSFDASSMAGIFGPSISVASGQTRLHFGLAVSREVVAEFGGSIEVETREPRGALFRVRIPAYSCAPAPAPQPKLAVTLLSPRPRVLLVDDEPIMCELLSELLADTCEVSTFSLPRAALARLLEGSFDVVLCDVMMPELNGVELFSQAIRARPELTERFVFITGGAFSERARLSLKQAGRPIVRKPCTREELLEAVDGIVRSHAPACLH